eukprot:gene18108-24540_t
MVYCTNESQVWTGPHYHAQLDIKAPHDLGMNPNHGHRPIPPCLTGFQGSQDLGMSPNRGQAPSTMPNWIPRLPMTWARIPVVDTGPHYHA